MIKCLKGFAFSATISTICLFFIEIAVRLSSGFDYTPITPEFLSLFPSHSMAMEVDILLYGMIGMTFSGMTFIYEKDHIGFVLQNIIYCIATGIVWIPIVTFLWQLWRYPAALFYTIGGFLITYMIITTAMYHTTKKDIAQINDSILNAGRA